MNFNRLVICIIAFHVTTLRPFALPFDYLKSSSIVQGPCKGAASIVSIAIDHKYLAGPALTAAALTIFPNTQPKMLHAGRLIILIGRGLCGLPFAYAAYRWRSDRLSRLANNIMGL